MSGNSYLQFSSCFHPAWEINTPGGQFNRLRLNCSQVDEYITQGASLPQKFEGKGYSLALIQEAYNTHIDPSIKKKTHDIRE